MSARILAVLGLKDRERTFGGDVELASVGPWYAFSRVTVQPTGRRLM